MALQTQEERKVALMDAMEPLSAAFIDTVDQQGKLMASNLFLMYGQKMASTAEGVVIASVGAASGILLWAKAEGLIEFTDAALASPEELAKREASKPAEKAQIERTGNGMERPPGAYL